MKTIGCHRAIGGSTTRTRSRKYLLGVSAVACLSALASAPGHAESNDDLAAEIKALKAQIREMKSAIAETRVETRRTQAKVRSVASRTPAPAYTLPPPAAPIPAGATPVFVTADKRMQFGAITITPGGFVAAESVFRTRTTQSDINTDYRALPFGNSPLGHTNEFRFTARQSRLALLAEGAITPTFVAAAYLEMDFLAAANTANANEANGFNPRVRQLYAQLDNDDYGMHVVAGQIFSLATLNSKGITPRNEVTPPSIDGQYIPGFVWARQAGIRLTKDFNKKLWFSLAAEESQTTFANSCPSGVNGPNGNNGANPGGAFPGNGVFGADQITGVTCSAAGTGGGFAGNSNNFSLNHVPDVIAKAAYEARFAERDVHLETFGLYRNFYDRVAYTDGAGFGQNMNRNTTGYGIGAGIIIPVIPRRVDFQASGLYGRGIGRYGTSQLADTTFNPDGSLRALREGIGLAGFTVHATPSIDVYAFGGIEANFRNYNENFAGGVPQGSFYGVGGPGGTTANIQGCNIEPNASAMFNPPGACTSTGNGNIKQIFQLTGGFWDKVYKGSFGEVRAGVQYQFNERQIYNNIPGVPGVVTNNYQPKTFDHAVLTSLRYYPFQ